MFQSLSLLAIRSFFRTWWQLLSLLFVGSLISCGTGGSALPQASIPPPSDDIQVSSPDSQGFVVVQGSSSSQIPDSGVVTIEVVSSSASLSLPQLPGLIDLIPKAYAATCESELPQCPELDGDNKCQKTANTDGSFSLRVPAGATDSLIIGYLDPNAGCEEVQAYGETPDSSAQGLDFDIEKASFLTNDRSALVLTSDNTLKGFDIDTNASFDVDAPDNDTITQIESFTDHNDNEYVFISTESGTYVGKVTSTSSGIDLDYYELVDSEGLAIAEANLVGTMTDTKTDSDYCLSDSLFSSSTKTYTRIFLSHGDEEFGAEFLTIEFVDDINDVESGHLVNSDQIVMRNPYISADFQSILGTSSSVTLDSIDTIFTPDNFLAFLLKLSTPTTSNYVVIRRPWLSSDSLCYSSIDFSGSFQSLNLGSTSGELRYHNSGTNILSVFKPNEQSLSIVNILGATLNCLTNGEILFDSSKTKDAANKCNDHFATNVGSGFTTPSDAIDKVAFVAVLPSSSLSKTVLLVLGEDSSGSRVLSLSSNTSPPSPSEEFFGENPIGFFHDAANTDVVILDKGSDDDDQSVIKTYDYDGSSDE
ncbi:MAG: hypothetical protein H7A33_03170 [Deltaproteobacteria bacterium]|nr:hypothetical protein [Deltaproteobacteria bacterium]